MPEESKSLSANQLIGYNLARIRKALGLSQEEAADRLAPLIPGKRWSKTVYSAAERSFDGSRIRNFDGDELLAMALAFEVPVAYFLLPPRPEDRPGGAVMVSGTTEVPWREVILAVNGYQYAPAILMRLRELPKDEQPPRTLPDGPAERYGLVPGSQSWHEVVDGEDGG